MSSINQTILVGRVGQDPVPKYFPSGVMVLNFSVATSKSKKVNNEWQSQTTWHNVVALGKLAESINGILKKGSSVSVVGENETRSWEKDGIKHYKHQIIAKTVVVGSSTQQTQDMPDPAGDDFL